MLSNYFKNNTRLNLNNFFNKISLKKQYIKQLKNKIIVLNNIKKQNYKVVNLKLIDTSVNRRFSKVSYILDFSFSRTNTVLHIMDCLGNTKFSYSAGLFELSGKQKVFQSDVLLNKFYKILVNDLSFLRGVPIAIHFKNNSKNHRLSWFVKKLKKRFFIVVVKFFVCYPYNGCRRKKKRRKKFKTIKNEDMAERFKAVDCKSIE